MSSLFEFDLVLSRTDVDVWLADLSYYMEHVENYDEFRRLIAEHFDNLVDETIVEHNLKDESVRIVVYYPRDGEYRAILIENGEDFVNTFEDVISGIYEGDDK